MTVLTAWKQYWYVPLITILLTTAIALAGSLLLPQKYESTATLLVIQQQSSGIDAYTAARSARTISETLVNVIGSSTFMQSVILNPGYRVEDTFSQQPIERAKEWNEAVQAETANEDGTIHVRIEHEDRAQARAIAFSVAATVIEKAKEYHGGGDTVVVKLIDEPITSLYPTEPNIVNNGIAGAVIGLLVSLGFVQLLAKKEGVFGGSTTLTSLDSIDFSAPQEHDVYSQQVIAPYKAVQYMGAGNSTIDTEKGDTEEGNGREWSAYEHPFHQEQRAIEHQEVEVMPVAMPLEHVVQPQEQKKRDADILDPDKQQAPEEIHESKEEGERDDVQLTQQEQEEVEPGDVKKENVKKRKQQKKQQRKQASEEKYAVRKQEEQEEQKQENPAMASFSGGLQELRAQMQQRKDARMQNAPVQQSQQSTQNVPAPSLSDQIKARIQKSIPKQSEGQQQKNEQVQTKPEINDDTNSAENWIKTGSFSG